MKVKSELGVPKLGLTGQLLRWRGGGGGAGVGGAKIPKWIAQKDTRITRSGLVSDVNAGDPMTL